MQVSLTVNGVARHADVEPRTLLVHLLREVLGLTGTNVGCDTTSCGACTVLAALADGGEVTTIEGMATDGALHPMQVAFMENHGLQCGYCTPGMVMASTALIAEAQADGRTLDEQAVREGLEGNLCRCTGYQNIVASVLACANGEVGAATDVQVRQGVSA